MARFSEVIDACICQYPPGSSNTQGGRAGGLEFTGRSGWHAATRLPSASRAGNIPAAAGVT